MTLIRWNTSRDIDTLQRRFERLFDDMQVPTNWKEFSSLSKIPAAELNETNEAIILKLEVPGIDPKDLDIQVSEDLVSISGERKSETKSEENGTLRSEFQYGQFKRVIPLPNRIENTQVTADYKDGILYLILPKTEADKHKVVKVDVKTA